MKMIKEISKIMIRNFVLIICAALPAFFYNFVANPPLWAFLFFGMVVFGFMLQEYHFAELTVAIEKTNKLVRK